MASRSSSAFLAHFCQKSGSSREMSVLLPGATKLAYWDGRKVNRWQSWSRHLRLRTNLNLRMSKVLTLAKVEPLPSDSMVMVWVRLWRIWSMSSSQNLEPSSSSSMRAPYAPFLSRSSISFLDNCWTWAKNRSVWVHNKLCVLRQRYSENGAVRLLSS